MRPFLIRVGIPLVAVWMLLSAVIGIVAVEGALHPGRSPLTAADTARAEAIAASDHAALSAVSIAAQDGVILRAWYLTRDTGNGTTVILLHGQGANRAAMLSNADLLLRHGFSALLPDARAHGESGGAIATYGIKEASDLERWYEWLHHSNHGCVDALGESMGAAELLTSLRAEPSYCAVVAESSFSSFQEAAYDRLGQEFRTGPWLGRTLLRPALWAGLLYTRWKYGLDLDTASPQSAVQHSHVPIFLIHGLADTNLPPRHSETMKAINPAIVLWEPRKAWHCGASAVEPQQYEARVVTWFEDHPQPTLQSMTHPSP